MKFAFGKWQLRVPRVFEKRLAESSTEGDRLSAEGYSPSDEKRNPFVS